MIYQLPQELLSTVYTYDDTYRSHFKENVADELKEYVRSYHHRCKHAVRNGNTLISVIGECRHKQVCRECFIVDYIIPFLDSLRIPRSKTEMMEIKTPVTCKKCNAKLGFYFYNVLYKFRIPIQGEMNVPPSHMNKLKRFLNRYGQQLRVTIKTLKERT